MQVPYTANWFGSWVIGLYLSASLERGLDALLGLGVAHAHVRPGWKADMPTWTM